MARFTIFITDAVSYLATLEMYPFPVLSLEVTNGTSILTQLGEVRARFQGLQNSDQRMSSTAMFFGLGVSRVDVTFTSYCRQDRASSRMASSILPLRG